MRHTWTTWPQRFVRWLFGSPFYFLPRAFGSPLPAELRLFRFRAIEATRPGLGKVAVGVPAHHERTRPARQDSALERQ